jgi:hypothetical protein
MVSTSEYLTLAAISAISAGCSQGVTPKHLSKIWRVPYKMLSRLWTLQPSEYGKTLTPCCLAVRVPMIGLFDIGGYSRSFTRTPCLLQPGLRVYVVTPAANCVCQTRTMLLSIRWQRRQNTSLH